MAGERLDKILSSQNIGSRKQVGQMIRKGRVCVAGAVVRDPGYKVEAQQTAIQVDGEPLTVQRYLYLMMNKPQGVLSATQDQHAQTVLDLVPPRWRRKGLFPAGRLDKDVSGLLLLTNDGGFAHRMLAPKNHVYKWYEARLRERLAPDAAERFREGLLLPTGERCRSAGLQLVEDAEQPLVHLCICEGKFHQVKRMFLAVQNEVLSLKRFQIGALQLDPALLPGECRALSPEEISKVWKFDAAI